MCKKRERPRNVRPQSFRVRDGTSESPLALAATGTFDGRKTARGDRKLWITRVAADPWEDSPSLPIKDTY